MDATNAIADVEMEQDSIPDVVLEKPKRTAAPKISVLAALTQNVNVRGSGNVKMMLSMKEKTAKNKGNKLNARKRIAAKKIGGAIKKKKVNKAAMNRTGPKKESAKIVTKESKAKKN